MRKNRQDTVGRRDVLQTVGAGIGVGATGVLAGCGGDTGSPSEANDTAENTLKLVMNRSYATLQANHHAAQTDSPSFPDWYAEHYASYDIINDEIGYYFIESFDVEGSTISISIRDDGTWYNGDSVTAEDVSTQFKLLSITENDPRLGNSNLLSGFDGIQTTGEYSIDVELDGEYNPRLATLQVLAPSGRVPALWTPAAVFGRFVESYDDATTDEERESVLSELTEFGWSYDDAYGCGLWKVDDIGSTQITLSLFEDHRAADGINFDTVRFRPIEDPVPALRNQELDRVPTLDAGTPLPDNFVRPNVDVLSSGGPALMFDHQHDMYGQTAFKQAIAFLVDKREIAEVRGPETHRPGPGDNAMHPNFKDKFITGSVDGTLIDYGVESKPQRATERLESLDFTREDGTWYTDSDEELTMEINTPSGSWATIANTVAGQLDQFGINTDVLSEEGSTFFSKYTNKTYPTPIEFWSGGKATPYWGFDRNMVGFGGDTMDYPAEVEAPPVGDRDGALQTYNIQELLETALRADTEEAFKSAIQDLAWVQNYEITSIPLVMSTLRNSVNDIEGWTFPEPDSEAWGWARAMHRQMLQGDFQAR